MSRLSDLPPDLLELLSAAVDDALSPDERSSLEARLAHDAQLRLALVELRQARKGLSQLPRLRVPRNFTLTPELVGRRGARPAYPRLRLATALAALAFALTFGMDSLLARSGVLPPGMPAASQAGALVAELSSDAAGALPPEAADVPQATEGVSEAPAEAERSAADALAEVSPTALPTPEPALKAGAVGNESTPEMPAAPAVSEPAPELAQEMEEQEEAPAEGFAAATQQRAPSWTERAAARPLQALGVALGALTLILGAMAVRARRSA
jgi:hypothetical protein